MRAVVCKSYGDPDVLEIHEIPRPEPKASEVLVKVHASAVGFGDIVARDFRISPKEFWLPGPLWLVARLAMGWSKPRARVFGGQFAGVVASVGADVTEFQVGDAVWAYPGQRFGGHAEYATISAKGMIGPMPDNQSFAEAACFPYGATTVLSLLSKADILPGHKVLVNGASGGLGSWAVQIAKHRGAHVTGVCSAAKQEYVRSLGAEQTLDYSTVNFWEGDARYDLVFDTTRHAQWSDVRRVLSPQGLYLRAVFSMSDIWQSLLTKRGHGPRMLCALSGETPRELDQARQLAEQGVLKAVIDSRYPLADARAAHARFQSGQHRGHVVLVMEDDA